MKILNTALLTAMLIGHVHTAAAEEDEKKPWIKKQVTVRAGAVIDGDYFAAGETVEISGTINGDVYVAGGRVVVDGRIKGDLLAAGGKVTVSGTVSQDARIAGGQVIVSGTIGRNVTLAGGEVEIAQSADVRGGVVAAGGSVEMAGLVEKDVRAAGATITFSGGSGGRLIAAGRAIRLTSKARIDRDVTYWSDAAISVDEEATIGGRVIRRDLPQSLMDSMATAGGWLSRVHVIVAFISFVSTLILGLLLIRFYPTGSKQVVDTLRRRAGVSCGVGFVALIVTPAVAALLVASIVASFVGVILMAAYLLMLYLGRIYAILLAGEIMLSKSSKAGQQGWALGLGAAGYFLLTLIPVVGVVVTMLAVVLGSGATVLVATQLNGLMSEDHVI